MRSCFKRGWIRSTSKRLPEALAGVLRKLAIDKGRALDDALEEALVDEIRVTKQVRDPD